MQSELQQEATRPKSIRGGGRTSSPPAGVEKVGHVCVFLKTVIKRKMMHQEMRIINLDPNCGLFSFFLPSVNPDKAFLFMCSQTYVQETHVFSSSRSTRSQLSARQSQHSENHGSRVNRLSSFQKKKVDFSIAQMFPDKK